MLKRRILAAAGALLLVLAICAAALYSSRDPESRDLDAAARAAAPGRFVRLSDGMTHYVVDGPDSGRVVVLAHGFSVPWYIWDSTAAALAAAGYRVVRYDAYGRGFSDRPAVEYSDRLYERQLGELLDSLRVAKADLGGVSAGGYVAGVFAGRHPDRVRSVILVDPVAGTSAASMRPYDLPLVGEYLWKWDNLPTMASGQTSDFIDPSRFPGWVDRYRDQMRYRGFAHSLWSSRVFRRGIDYDTVYRRVAAANVPVLLLWGEKDHTVPFERNELVRRSIPAVEFHAIPDAAHLPILERAPLTDSLIADFLRRHH